MEEEKNVIVYRHVRLDTNEVFYVGIGNEKRPFDKRGRNEWWKRIVDKTEYRVDILFDDLTLEQAYEKEKEFIQLYGRKDLGLGELVNLTDGGDGIHNLSEETKLKMSLIRTGKTHSEKTKLKMSQAQIGNIKSEETKQKISNSNKQRFINNPNKLDEMRKRERQRYIDNPELKDIQRIRGRQNITTNNTGLRQGIRKEKNGKFGVRIRIGDNKRLYLGQYITYEEALEVRLNAEDKYWGTNHLN